MLAFLKKWYRRHFSDPEAVILLLTVVFICVFVLNTGVLLAPVYASLVIAYLLQGSVTRLDTWHLPHILSVSLVSLLAFGVFFAGFVWLLPLVWQEIRHFINEMPDWLQQLQAYLKTLPNDHGAFINNAQIDHIMTLLRHEVGSFGRNMLSLSVAAIPSLIELVVYAILVPMMVFFFLKDGTRMLAWMGRFLPKKSRLVYQVRDEVHLQTARYVRGKFLELMIVFVINAILFRCLHLHYAIVLAFFSGVSVLIPYVGVFLVSIPVVLVSFFQYGMSTDFIYLMIGYGTVMLLDGNVLVPILFSETMAIHPVAIIIAIIFFGGIWGFWGIFFAIPLATVVKAMITAWPSVRNA